MPSYSTNLNLAKPTVGGDTNQWGGYLNTNTDTLDAIFNGSGTGTSVGLQVGSGKTLKVGGTLTATGSSTFSGTVSLSSTVQLTGSQNELRFFEAIGGADNYVALKAPNEMTGNNNYSLVLPAAQGTAGQFLKLTSLSGSEGLLQFADAGSSIGGATGVDFNDSVEARFGTGNDFSIQHNGSNTILAHSGTGDMQIRAINSGKAFIIYNHDGTSEMLKLSDTNGYLSSAPTASLSSGQSPNVYINNSGTFKKSTSALKYKKDVRDLESIDISSFRPVRYKSNIAEDETNEDFIGFIADEFHDAGLTELVSYGDNNEVEGFNYDRMTAVLTKALQEVITKIESLESEIDQLKGVN